MNKFKLFVVSTGLNYIAGGVTLGVFYFYNDYYPEFEELYKYTLNSSKSVDLALSLSDKCDYVVNHVSYNCDELLFLRTLRNNIESSIYLLLSRININLKECDILLTSNLPLPNINNIQRIKNTKLYPAFRACKILNNRERRNTLEKYHILYPQYKLIYNLGAINPTHISALIHHGLTVHHRGITLKMVADRIYDRLLVRDPNYLDFKFLYHRRIPSHWVTHFKKKHNLDITRLKDLYTSKERSRIPRYFNSSRIYNDYNFIYNNSIPNDMRDWLNLYIPSDLKNEIIL